VEDGLITAAWRKSSYSSGGEANCVEVAAGAVFVAVRDTKDRGAGHVPVSPKAWTSLLDSLR
jgi:hypothetical protein